MMFTKRSTLWENNHVDRLLRRAEQQVLLRCCHLLKRGFFIGFSATSKCVIALLSLPFRHTDPSRDFFHRRIFFCRLTFFLHSFPMNVNLLNNSVLDWTACLSTFASLLRASEIYSVYQRRWIFKVGFCCRRFRKRFLLFLSSHVKVVNVDWQE